MHTVTQDYFIGFLHRLIDPVATARGYDTKTIISLALLKISSANAKLSKGED